MDLLTFEPSYITFQSRWRICEGSEHDVWRLNLALAGLIRSRPEEGDFVSIVGPYSSGLVNCADLRVGLRAVSDTLRELHLDDACAVRWLDLRELVWRGVRCADVRADDLHLT